MLDLILAGGFVVDGTGAPPWRADIAVSGTRIVAVGRLGDLTAHSVIDVSNRYLMPGFIDVHAHLDALLTDDAVQLAALSQGVTTVILGQDGLSFAPSSAPTARAVASYFAAVNGQLPIAFTQGCSVAELLAHYDQAGALNAGYLAPAGTLRIEALGYSAGPADPDQLRKMRVLLEQALADGALGLSSGLEYVPGRHADVAETAALCAPVADAGGVYVSHIRGYEADAWRGLAELADVARRSGVAAHASHLHGPANMIIELLDQDRAAGLDLTFDSYPYLRGSTILAMVALPAELQQAGPDATLARLSQPAVREALHREWFPAIRDVLDRVRLAHIGSAEWSWAEGKSLRAAADQARITPGELVCELILASSLAVGCVFGQPPTNTEHDLRSLLRHEAQMLGSDAIMLGSQPHPRGWGAFARALARHTRELGDWSWGEAAVHLAGHPARRFGLTDRGALRTGYLADVVVLDPATIQDQADYDHPRRPATGVDHVLVNGEFVLRDGALTGVRAGRALRRGESYP